MERVFKDKRPEDVSIDQLLSSLGVDSSSLKKIVENNREKLPVWKRAITYQFLKVYLNRSSFTAKEDVRQMDFPESLISHSMLEFVKKDTLELNCSVAELVKAIEQSVPRNSPIKRYPPLFFKPTHFLSYCWDFPLKDIFDVAMGIAKTHGDNWGLWIDILTINQHQGEKTKEDLAALDKVISEIGTVIFVIDAKGSAMKRVWCLFEIMTAVKCSADITAVFMSRNRNAYEAAMIGLSVICGRFDDIDVRKAQATVESDRDMILGQIEQGIGIDEMNKLLKDTLKSSARKEFEKERMNFGSVWWSGSITFPDFVMKGLVSMIEENGGWEAMFVTLDNTDPNSAASETPSQKLNVKMVGELDSESDLYKKVKLCIDILTWGQRQNQFSSWDEVLLKMVPTTSKQDDTDEDNAKNVDSDNTNEEEDDCEGSDFSDSDDSEDIFTMFGTKMLAKQTSGDSSSDSDGWTTESE